MAFNAAFNCEFIRYGRTGTLRSEGAEETEENVFNSKKEAACNYSLTPFDIFQPVPYSPLNQIMQSRVFL